jgi:hypothetical protein
MKSLIAAFALTFSTATFANVEVPNFNWSVEDIQEKKLTKEELFKNMDRDFINLGQSICANRAMMWLYDFKKSHDINGAKVFLFYTAKTSKKWWYHVAPVINENNELFAMDAGFPGFIDSPLKIEGWISKFAEGKTCKAIRPEDTEIIEAINKGTYFPEVTESGRHDCYYILAPAGYWFPNSVYTQMKGLPSNITEELQTSDVYQACKEAVTTPIGRFLGTGKKKCKRFINRN